MKRIITAGITLAVLALPVLAQANRPTRAHVRQYQRDYHQVARKFGRRTPGRNIVKDALSSGRAASDQDIVKSLAVLQRMLAPPPVPVYTSTSTSTSTPTSTSTYTPSASSVPSGGGLISCIISHESGGDPNATSPGGTYGGIGQWSAAAWAQDGGTRYAATPQGATYAQQYSVLAGEGEAGMASQQGQYDGC